MKFFASSLLSKWGNRDGDILEELLYDYAEENDIPWCSIDEHKILKIVIEKYVVPKITPKIELEFIETIHNPIRAKTINGLDCTHLWFSSPNVHIGLLSPEEIEVSDELIIKELERMERDKE